MAAPKSLLFNFLDKIKSLKSYDKFGKEINLYYEKKEKTYSWIGFIFTLFYLILYITYLIYKLTRMLRRKDVVFIDSFSYIKGHEPIKLSKDNFYGGFAIEDPKTYDTIIDESIYYPKAYFRIGRRIGKEWIWEKDKELELEQCKLEKFGKFYQDKFNHISLDSLYCFKEMNESLFGHFSYNEYSFFYIQLFPCVNSTENKNKCKPKEMIDYYLNGTFLCMEFEDIELNPQNYTLPVTSRSQDIYFKVGKKLFQEIHIYYQIVEVETDEDRFGIEIESFQKIKKENYLKYNSFFQMPNIIESDIYQTGESFCNITIKLHDQVRTQRRTYTKFIAISEEVGGFMETLFAFLNIISSFPIDILYKIRIFNKLFIFDLKSNLIKSKALLKSKRPIDFIDADKRDKNSIKIRKNNSLSKSTYNKEVNNEAFISLSKDITSKYSSFTSHNNIYSIISTSKDDKLHRKDSDINLTKQLNIIEKIENITINPFYIYYYFPFNKLCKKNRNFFLEKSMDIFKDKMDIITIFKKLLNDGNEIILDQEPIIEEFKFPDYLKKNYQNIS